MKSLSRVLGVLSLLLAISAVVVPLVGVATLLFMDSGSAVSGTSGVGLTMAVVALLLAIGGYMAGRRHGATAIPIIGGMVSLFAAIGFVVAPVFT